MTTRPSDAFRAVFGRREQRPGTLPSEHPLARTLDLLVVLGRQAVVAAIALAAAVAAAVERVPLALPLLVAAAVVELALVLGIALLVQLAREHARDLIIAGRDELQLPAVVAERRRLLDRRQRERLARSLERTLRAAENWERLAVASRPPPGARRLRAVAPELREVVSELRRDEVDVRGVALVARLVAGGYASPLYEGRIDELRPELALICHHLSTSPHAEKTAATDGRAR